MNASFTCNNNNNIRLVIREKQQQQHITIQMNSTKNGNEFP